MPNTLSPRWRKVLRDLWYNKTRTILVVLSIAVGVMSIGMISGSQAILARDMRGAYLATNPRHAILFTDSFDDDLLKAIRRIPAVADAVGQRRVNARVSIGPDAWQALELFVVEDFNNVRINKTWHLEGATTPPRRTLLLERASLDKLEKKIDDTLLVQLDDGREQTLQISGKVHDVNQVPAVFSGEVQGYITLDTLEKLGYTRDFNRLLFTVTEHQFDREHILAVTQVVKAKLEKSGRTVYGEYVPTPGEHWATDDVNSMLFLLGALGILSLFLSGFLVVNTISALLTHQVQQIGIMKTIGARTNQLLVIYFGKVIAYGLLSLLIAVPLGALGALGLTNYIASLLNFEIVSFDISPRVLVLELAVGLIMPLVAALVPVLFGLRVTVREAISSYGLGSGLYGRHLIDEIMRRIRGAPRPVLVSLRNTFRRKGRLLLVLITLTLASAIFIGVLSVQASLLLTLDDALRYWQYDIGMAFNRSYRIEQLQREALTIPGVVEAEAWGFWDAVRKRSATEQSDDILLIAPPTNTQFIDPIILEGRWLLPEDEYAVVINTDLLKEEPDLKVGDDIVLEIDERESSWRIVGLVKQPLAGPFAYMNYPIFAQVTRQMGRVSNVRVMLHNHDGETQAELAKNMETHFEARGYRVRTVRTTFQEREESENSLNIIVVFLLIMAVLLAFVGGLGLMGTMSINVLERTREVGVMRAIGASNGSILQIVMVEGVVIGMISWLLGALLSMPLGQVLATQVGILFLGAPASYTFSNSGALLWLGIVTLLAALASFLPAWNAARMTVRETLAYQ